MQLLFIGIGGFAGAIARYTISGGVNSFFGARLPYGTLVVNVLGSFLLGLVYALSVEKNIVPPALRLPLSVGFLGALTTFSTFSLETVHLVNAGNFLYSILNISINILLSIAAVIMGMYLAKVF